MCVVNEQERRVRSCLLFPFLRQAETAMKSWFAMKFGASGSTLGVFFFSSSFLKTMVKMVNFVMCILQLKRQKISEHIAPVE